MLRQCGQGFENKEKGQHRKRAFHVIGNLTDLFRINISLHIADEHALEAAEHRLTLML